jgi:hypothetical protein
MRCLVARGRRWSQGVAVCVWKAAQAGQRLGHGLRHSGQQLVKQGVRGGWH